MDTIVSQLREKPAIKFTEFNPDFMKKSPQNETEFKFLIQKGFTNLDAAEDSLDRIRNSKLQLIARYISEQSY